MSSFGPGGVPRGVRADGGLVEIPAVVMALLTMSVGFRESLVLSAAAAAAAAAYPWELVEVKGVDDIGMGETGRVVTVSRSMRTEDLNGGCEYMAGNCELMNCGSGVRQRLFCCPVVWVGHWDGGSCNW